MTCRVMFHVVCQWTVPGQSVWVVGGLPQLGQWDWHQGLLLSTQQDKFPRWRGVVDLPCDREFDYKFCVVDAQGQVVWESFEGNRHMHALTKRDALYDVLDGVLGTKRSTPARVIETDHNQNPTTPQLEVCILRHGERWAFVGGGFDAWTRHLEIHNAAAQATDEPQLSRFDDPLTWRGCEMSRRAGKRIYLQSATRRVWFYSSPWTRCVQTAAYAILGSGIANASIAVEPGLMEHLHRTWYGGTAPLVVPQHARAKLAKPTTSSLLPLAIDAPNHQPSVYHPDVGIDLSYSPVCGVEWPEDMLQLQERVVRVVNTLTQAHRGEIVTLFTHGYWIDHGVFGGLLMGTQSMRSENSCGYTALTKLTFVPHGWGWQLQLDRDDTHIADLRDVSAKIRYV